MKSSHRIVHSDRNCEDESACLSLLSESAFLNADVILPFFYGICWKNVFFSCHMNVRTHLHACGTRCMWYCFEYWVWRTCTAENILTSHLPNSVPACIGLTYVSHLSTKKSHIHLFIPHQRVFQFFQSAIVRLSSREGNIWHTLLYNNVQ